LSFGNRHYNPVTARFYTDLSLLTSDPQITERVHMVFNYLTAHAEIDDYKPLLVAPLTMAESFLGLIRREQEHAQAGRLAHIVAKMNALLEPSVIDALYQASQSGVEVDLIVRGLSILRPGVKGLSERIRVRSIVGRFLEHSRIYHFANGGDGEIYLAQRTGCLAIYLNAAKWSFRCAMRLRVRAFTTKFCPLCWQTPSKLVCNRPMATTFAPAN